MSRHEHGGKLKVLIDDENESKIEPGNVAPYKPDTKDAVVSDLKLEDTASTSGGTPTSRKSAVGSFSKQSSTPHSPAVKSENEEFVGGGITVKLEAGQPPKLSRAASKKIIARPPALYTDLPDATTEAIASFTQLSHCVYANKFLGSTEHALECDCTEEWDVSAQINRACGEDSDCINRATKMECIDDCACGSECQNQRFQRKQYANVSVIQTEKKGYGLRADSDFKEHQFIFEYIGEVIGESSFRKRMVQYDTEGIKHFYFMSLSKGEFVDATKKGNLGRFCNHSCNPNCYVDKWVVGDKLRMGIFAERAIAKGEELVFNYNVDRYGANPQPCYCGEPNCTGYIGGKTQTERATKLSTLTIEALGIEDGEDWDTAVAKKSRGKKKVAGEDDEEYVQSVQPKSLDEGGVTKVMATLMQCKEKWIAVKLLSRIQRCEEDKVRHRVVRVHGYQILSSALSTWMEDDNVVLQILDILDKLPRLTRNKIQDSKIEATVEKLKTKEDERVKEGATKLLQIWSSLELAYRIPRMKRDPSAIAAADRAEREERRRARSRSKSRSRSSSPEPGRGLAAPSGPRAGVPQRFAASRPPFRRPFNNGALPAGWHSAQSNGQTYYYSTSGETTWQRPTQPVSQPPPPPKVISNEQKLQDIINSITKGSSAKDSPIATPDAQATVDIVRPERKQPKEKWRSYSEEKQKKLYENTLFPHVKYVMDKFKGKLPKEDLKRFAKEIAKKLVNSDFKNKRVDNPSYITSKQEKQVKKYVKDFFDKAVAKRREHEQKKADKKTKEAAYAAAAATLASASVSAPASSAQTPTKTPESRTLEEDEEIVLSENEIEDDDDDEEPSPVDTSISPAEELKRKREADDTPLTSTSDTEHATATSGSSAPTTKKLKSQTPPSPALSPPPPPPPPPPPGSPPPPQSDSQQVDEVEVDVEMEVELDPIKNTTPHPDEAGLTPGEDISGSFTNEALEAVSLSGGGHPLWDRPPPPPPPSSTGAQLKTELST